MKAIISVPLITTGMSMSEMNQEGKILVFPAFNPEFYEKSIVRFIRYLLPDSILRPNNRMGRSGKWDLYKSCS